MGPERRIGIAVHADQLGGHTLTHLGFVAWFCEHDEAGVGVHIDEPGADNSSLGVDDACSLNVGQVAPQDVDLLSFHSHGPIEPWIAAAIDDQSISNQEIEHATPPAGPVSV
jgi:hypothetical protein